MIWKNKLHYNYLWDGWACWSLHIFSNRGFKLEISFSTLILERYLDFIRVSAEKSITRFNKSTEAGRMSSSAIVWGFFQQSFAIENGDAMLRMNDVKLLEPCFTEWQMTCFVILDELCRPIVDIYFNLYTFVDITLLASCWSSHEIY